LILNGLHDSLPGRESMRPGANAIRHRASSARHPTPRHPRLMSGSLSSMRCARCGSAGTQRTRLLRWRHFHLPRRRMTPSLNRQAVAAIGGVFGGGACRREPSIGSPVPRQSHRYCRHTRTLDDGAASGHEHDASFSPYIRIRPADEAVSGLRVIDHLCVGLLRGRRQPT
jgi:hypothetical protein